MKIWCTYYRAGSLQMSGLERVSVWFAKPVFQGLVTRDLTEDLPFGYPADITHGIYENHYWTRFREGGSKEDTCVSFGKAFGYGDEGDPEIAKLANYVWDKLCEHFDNRDLHKWDEIERKGKDANPPFAQPWQFCLEIDLSIDINL